MSDRYGSDVLAGDWRKPKNGPCRRDARRAGRGGRGGRRPTACGEIVAVDRDLHTLTLEDRRGKRRTFPLGPGFWLEGKPVILTRPGDPRRRPPKPTRTASGSVAVHGAKARVARGQPDLRRGASRRRAGREGLGRRPADRGRRRRVSRRCRRPRRPPGRVQARTASGGSACSSTTWSRAPRRPGSRSRSRRSAVGQHVLIVGHPFIDVWQAVKPERLGLERLADVPRSIEWKKGICQHLGWPHRDQADIARAWKHILGTVSLLRRPRARPARAGSRS